MHVGARGPAEPEARGDEERPRDAGEREAHHFLVAAPRRAGLLRARQVPVPGQVDGGGDEGADADGEEGQALLARREVVDVGEDERVGLQVDVEYGVWRVSEKAGGVGWSDLHA